MVIDTFLFSDPSEINMLEIKLNVENDLVDLWILQENKYTLKGEEKGLWAKQTLSDSRFDPFRDKVVILSAEEKRGNGQGEGDNFNREGWQRTLCYDYIKSNYDSNETVIVISDTDEMLCCDGSKYAAHLLYLRQNRPYCVRRRRYWYQLNNECNLTNIKIPVIPWEFIRDNKQILSTIRHHQDVLPCVGTYEDPLAFEYSYMFQSLDDVFQKKSNYSHTGFSRESVENALKLNCWARPQARNEKINPSTDFFEFIELTEQNSPKYVRDNLARLQNNIVDPNYKENRKHWTSDYT